MTPDPDKLSWHFRDYLDQLLEDIEEAGIKAQPFFRDHLPDPQIPSEHAPYKSLGFVTFHDLFGITREALPPADQLSSSELTILSYKLIRLLETWHFYFDFPNLLPDKEKYKIICHTWNSPYKLAVHGETHIDICLSNTDKCPYVGYCSICEELNDEEGL
jgi:hypothetical protein